jgi:hypothetical protein
MKTMHANVWYLDKTDYEHPHDFIIFRFVRFDKTFTCDEMIYGEPGSPYLEKGNIREVKPSKQYITITVAYTDYGEQRIRNLNKYSLVIGPAATHEHRCLSYEGFEEPSTEDLQVLYNTINSLLDEDLNTWKITNDILVNETGDCAVHQDKERLEIVKSRRMHNFRVGDKTAPANSARNIKTVAYRKLMA